MKTLRPASRRSLSWFCQQGKHAACSFHLGLSCHYNLLKALLLFFSCPVISNSLQPHGHQASLSLTISQSLPKFMSIASVMPYSHLILWRPLLLLPLVFPSIRDFSNESFVYIRRPGYWSFNFSISPSSEYSRFISLKIDWLDLLAVQGTFRSLL